MVKMVELHVVTIRGQGVFTFIRDSLPTTELGKLRFLIAFGLNNFNFFS